MNKRFMKSIGNRDDSITFLMQELQSACQIADHHARFLLCEFDPILNVIQKLTCKQGIIKERALGILEKYSDCRA